MVQTIFLIGYVFVISMAFMRGGNWYRNLLILQIFLGLTLVGEYGLGYSHDFLSLGIGILCLAFSVIAFTPKVRTFLKF